MNFSIDSIKLKNFVCFEDQEIPLYDQGLVHIVGENIDEPWKGKNAVGKSIILNAIHWLFSGTTGRDIYSDGVIGKFGKSTAVSAKIRSGKSNIVVRRYRKDSKHGNGLKIFEGNDVSHRKIKDSQERLDKIIGCSFPLFKMSCFQNGDSSNNFSRMKPAERAKLLDEIIGSSESNIPKAYSAVNKKIREIKQDILLLNQSTANSEERIEYMQGNLKYDEDVIKKSKSSLDDQKEKHRQEIDVLLSDDVLVWQSKLKTFNKNLESITLIKQKQNKLRERCDEMDDDIAELNEKIINIKAKIKSNVRLNDQCLDENALCERCGNIASEKSLLNIQGKRDKEIKIWQDKIKIRQEKILGVEDKINSITKKIDSIEPDMDEFEIKSNINNCLHGIKRCEENKELADKKNLDMKDFIENYEKNNDIIKEKIFISRKKIQQQKDLIFKNAVSKKKLERELHKVEALSGFYSPSGFRPLAMKHYSPVLSECANYFFKDFTNDKGEIVIDSQSTNQQGKVSDKVDIKVSEFGVVKQFPGAWSEGEGGYIDLSLNSGVMRLASMKAAKTFNMLFLDETTNHLSMELINQLIKTLKQKFLKKGMTILLISHMPIPRSEVDKVWIVKKENGKSRIDFSG